MHAELGVITQMKLWWAFLKIIPYANGENLVVDKLYTTMSEYFYEFCAELSQNLCILQISSLELVEAYIHRIEQVSFSLD